MGIPVESWTAEDYGNVLGYYHSEDTPKATKDKLGKKLSEYEDANELPRTVEVYAAMRVEPEPGDEIDTGSPSVGDEDEDAFETWAASVEADVANQPHDGHPYLMSGRSEYEPYEPAVYFSKEVTQPSGPLGFLNRTPVTHTTNPQSYYEPTVQEFRAQARDWFPKRKDEEWTTLGRDSPEYKIFADQKWAEKWADAKAKGYSVERVEMLQKKREAEGTAKPLAGLGSDLKAAGISALDVGTFGAGTELLAGLGSLLPGQERAADIRTGMERVTEANPLASLAGGLYGGIRGAPGVLGGKLTSALPQAGGALGRVAQTGLVGSGMAVAEGGVEDSVHKLADVIRGAEHAYSVANSFNPLAGGTATTRALLGGGLGALGSGVGEFARGMTDSIRVRRGGEDESLKGHVASWVSQVEEFVGKPITTWKNRSGIERAPELEAGYDNPYVRGGGETFAGKAGDAVSRAAWKSLNEVEDRGRSLSKRYADSPQGQMAQTTDEVVDALEMAINERTFSGGPLPFSHSQVWEEALDRIVDHRIVRADMVPDGQRSFRLRDVLSIVSPEYGKKMLRESGHSDVAPLRFSPLSPPGRQEASAAIRQPPRERVVQTGPGRKTSDADAIEPELEVPGDLRLVVGGKPMTAGELDNAQARFHEWSTKEANTSGRLSIFDILDRAYMKVRDKFPPHPELAPSTMRKTLPDGTEVTGYSAMKRGIYEDRRKAENRLASVGGNPGFKQYDPADSKLAAGVASKLMKSNKKDGASVEVEEALQYLAKNHGLDMQTARRVQAAEAYKNLRSMAATFSDHMSNVGLLRRGFISLVGMPRFRIDPAFRTLAKALGKGDEVGKAIKEWQSLPPTFQTLVRGITLLPLKLGTASLQEATRVRGGATASIWTQPLSEPTVDDIMTAAGLGEIANKLSLEGDKE